jgi:hypothetical protein
LTAITKEAWNTAQTAEDKREKIQALSLAKECYSMKLDLLTNATVVDDAIRFVSDRSKEKLKSSANDSEHNKEESREPDYDEDEDRLEEQEEEIDEIKTIKGEDPDYDKVIARYKAEGPLNSMIPQSRELLRSICSLHPSD